MQFIPLERVPTNDPQVNAVISTEVHQIAIDKAKEELDPYAEDDEYTVFNKIEEGLSYVKDKVFGKSEAKESPPVAEKVVKPAEVVSNEPRVVPIANSSNDVVVIAKVAPGEPMREHEIVPPQEMYEGIKVVKRKSLWDSIMPKHHRKEE